MPNTSDSPDKITQAELQLEKIAAAKGRPISNKDKFLAMREREEAHHDDVEEERWDYDYNNQY